MTVTAADLAAALGAPPPTPEQIAVIEHPPGPMLVVAGAGSGKTETMAARVLWLVANGHVDADQILGLTFTRKAASELGHRITTRLTSLREAGVYAPGNAADVSGASPVVSTYHAYAGRLVREHGLRIGIEPESYLLSEAATWQVASEVVRAYEGPLDEVERAESTITNAVVDLAAELAEHVLTPAQLGEWLDGVDADLGAIAADGPALMTGSNEMRRDLRSRRALVPVLERYLALKRSRGALDFADQMSMAARLAVSFPEIGAAERTRFTGVLLDEFQDTSHAQMQLLLALFAPAGEAPHAVTAVGDPNQSIYAWRGASAATLSQFAVAFGGAAPAPQRPLSTTWRNDRRILDAANTVAGPLRRAARVDVAPLRPAPTARAGLLDVGRYVTIEEEAVAVADWVADQLRGGARSAAVLCRKRSLFPPIVDALTNRRIPTEVVGLGGLLLTPEVQDVVALLSVAQDATRGDRLMRLLTGPACRLGAADLDAFHAFAARTQRESRQPGRSHGRDLSDQANDQVSLVEGLVSFGAAGPRGAERDGMSSVARERLVGLAHVVDRVRALSGISLDGLVVEAERLLGLDIEVLARPGFTPAAARAHLDAFADVASSFAATSDRPTLGGFLAWLDAAIDEERGLDRGGIEIAPGAVQVLTVHAAKGLEWDAVAIPGLVEATFPAHTSSVSKWDDDAQQWAVSEPTARGWIGGLDSVPYALRGDGEALPVFDVHRATDAKDLEARRRAFRIEAGAHALAEERRLAYVATTRARRRMFLSAHLWGTQTSPRVVSRFLTEVVAAQPDDARIRGWAYDAGPGEANPRLASPVSAPWPRPPTGRDALRRAAEKVTMAPRSAAPLDGEIQLLLRQRTQAQAPPSSAAPSHLSTSGLVALAGDPNRFFSELRRPMPSAPRVSVRRGTAFHAFVERHYRRAALLDADELPGSADELATPEPDLDAMIARFLDSPWALMEPLDVELAVETVVEGIAIRGRIDAVFSHEEGGVTIVDWKSGAVPGPAASRTRSVQLAAYRLAYARLKNLDLQQVRAAFYYAESGETAYPDLPSPRQLGSLLDLLRAGGGGVPGVGVVGEVHPADGQI